MQRLVPIFQMDHHLSRFVKVFSRENVYRIKNKTGIRFNIQQLTVVLTKTGSGQNTAGVKRIIAKVFHANKR